MNRRVVCTRGELPADVLTVIEEPEPAAPERGQVLVRTTAFPVHPSDLLAEASAERRASDVATAKQIALALKDQFDVAGTYGLGELVNVVEHSIRPGRVGTVLVRPG